ncbi:MAG: hypothetical protein E8D52_04565 [Nitrospira sp.]|nr:MAG: hypothetical protein E8D52_04565 [Nitrospira sp.]
MNTKMGKGFDQDFFTVAAQISKKGEASDAAISDMVGEVSSNKTQAAWHGECVRESEESCHEKIPDIM